MTPAPDLFIWEAVRAAEAACVEAHFALDEARRRARRAPHGEQRLRAQAVMAAMQQALTAEAAMAAARARAAATGDEA